MRAPWLAVLLAGGCYAPRPPDGAACTTDKQCPDPLTCHFGKCYAAAPACVPIQGGSGALVAPMLATPIAIDGDLSDWPTCFVDVDVANAGLVRDLGAGGQFTPGRFSVAADAGHLYLAAEVTGVPPLGDQPPPDVFLNNAISVYFDGDGQIAGASYDADAAQIVVDHANREQAFRNGQPVVVPQVASAAATGSTTFTIELAVEPATFGLTAFPGTIGFDIGLVGGNGTNMTSELVWFQRCTRPACGCPSGTDAAPYCDAREFGTITFGP